MADLPIDELDGQTPLQAARTPNWDKLAEDGLVGTVLTVPEGMYPGSDVANMTLLGYDPSRYSTGRGPIEAVAMGISMDPHDVAFRCSLVTTDGTTMLDHSSGHISTEESAQLIQTLNKRLSNAQTTFYPGVSYRHIMVKRDASANVQTTPPHDFTSKPIDGHWPEGDGAEKLKQMMLDSHEILESHEVNHQRREEGKAPANMMWLWGQGYAPNIPSFMNTFGRQGSIITAVDVVRGLGRATGLEIVNVPGATGYIDTNYVGKAQYALKSLEKHDFVYIHIESPDESGHEGNLEHKLRSIEDIDRHVIGTLVSGMANQGEYRLLIAPDHKTPIKLRAHESGPVPFLLYDSSKPNRASRVPFDERALTEAKTHIDDGTRLIRILFQL